MPEKKIKKQAVPIVVEDRSDPRYRAYQDSLSSYNHDNAISKGYFEIASKYNLSKDKENPTSISPEQSDKIDKELDILKQRHASKINWSLGERIPTPEQKIYFAYETGASGTAAYEDVRFKKPVQPVIYQRPAERPMEQLQMAGSQLYRPMYDQMPVPAAIEPDWKSRYDRKTNELDTYNPNGHIEDTKNYNYAMGGDVIINPNDPVQQYSWNPMIANQYQVQANPTMNSSIPQTPSTGVQERSGTIPGPAFMPEGNKTNMAMLAALNAAGNGFANWTQKKQEDEYFRKNGMLQPAVTALTNTQRFGVGSYMKKGGLMQCALGAEFLNSAWMNPEEEIVETPTPQPYEGSSTPSNMSGEFDFEKYKQGVKAVENPTGDLSTVNPETGAMGDYQFLPSTLKGLYNAHFKDSFKTFDEFKGKYLKDQTLQDQSLQLLANENATTLGTTNPYFLAAAHFLGATKAKKLFAGQVDANSNPTASQGISNLSPGAYLDKFSKAYSSMKLGGVVLGNKTITNILNHF